STLHPVSLHDALPIYWASRRCAHLIREAAGGQLVEGVVDAYSQPLEPKTISLRPAKVTQLLGVELQREEIEAYLSLLGLKAARRSEEHTSELQSLRHL